MNLLRTGGDAGHAGADTWQIIIEIVCWQFLVVCTSRVGIPNLIYEQYSSVGNLGNLYLEGKRKCSNNTL